MSLVVNLQKQTVLDETLFEGRKRNEYFYNSKEYPTLKDAQGKIVILTNWELTYGDNIKNSIRNSNTCSY